MGRNGGAATAQKLVRPGVVILVCCGLGAGLWATLQFGFGVDQEDAVAGAVGFAPLLVAVIVWAVPSAVGRGSKRHVVPESKAYLLREVTDFFSDRTNEWAEIRAKTRAARSPENVCATVMIHGMPGVGKSEFAKYAAHKSEREFKWMARRASLNIVARQVDLHGHDGLTPIGPRYALIGLLNSVSIPDPKRSAMDVRGLSEEWRKQLRRKFLILLLDDATDQSQIQPLLPREPPYIVLVTGRRMLGGLTGGELIDYPLEVLDAPGAVELISKVAGRRSRKIDLEAVEGIAKLRGNHPMAITLAVRTLSQERGVSFADRLAQLNTAPDRLLEINEYANTGSSGVARSFELSYAQLSDVSKLVLRRLGLVPIPTISVEAAAGLSGLPIEVARACLRELTEDALITEAGRDDSYQMHGLIRRYARSLVSRDDLQENEAAVDRLLAYYQAGLVHVDGVLTRQPPPQAVETPEPTVSLDFVDRPSMITWARAELDNLLACADYVCADEQDSYRREEMVWVVLFASNLAGLLRNEGLWDRSIALQTAAIGAAEQVRMPLAA